MKLDRREFIKALAASTAWIRVGSGGKSLGGGLKPTTKTYDVAVIGAGVFGAWTAYHLRQAGKSVALVDAYGPANSRASSGGESRILRMGYGGDELYTRWAMRSLVLWRDFFRRTGQSLFQPTAVLWIAEEGESYVAATERTLERLGVRYEKLSREELARRYPQIAFDKLSWGLLEPDSGALLARRAVQLVVAETRRAGTEFLTGAVELPTGKGRLAAVHTRSGEAISAGSFVFACGPWLGKMFPALLGDRIFPTRQEVFFFGAPAGDRRFAPPAMPTWINLGDETYGLPDLEDRGFKVAFDRHGPEFDPDAGKRVVSAEGLAAMRSYVAKRFPALADAPVVETRVCQYENTSSGDFLIDRHPDLADVWLVGGGSGHGFKHGPALGEYVAERVLHGGAVEPRFSLATKASVQKRAVY
jgi:sarcosine oxidase